MSTPDLEAEAINWHARHVKPGALTAVIHASEIPLVFVAEGDIQAKRVDKR